MQFAFKLLCQFCFFSIGFMNVCCAASAVISGAGSSAAEPVYLAWAKGYESDSSEFFVGG
jgi:ABC-type phosphate transport system substrate-binding protein